MYLNGVNLQKRLFKMSFFVDHKKNPVNKIYRISLNVYD
ncbi:hypothetical protein GAGA_3222 [Paraglaciecola agarilytica NO2]|uniref:Uncharacterized protein n=1 Tax=Paraglaciecola agarilytica NO2 TaxID=1125747 RepID=A0ABQ0I9S0_9ALTE|nr:hypothetical protein GAGA_3222 [Paraglaciecola agarilytica NO2]